jgi:hypothetical protein
MTWTFPLSSSYALALETHGGTVLFGSEPDSVYEEQEQEEWVIK